MKKRFLTTVIAAIVTLGLTGVANATIHPVDETPLGATTVANQIKTPAFPMTSALFQTAPPLNNPNGWADAPLNVFPTNGPTFGILTSGEVTLADDPNCCPNSGTADGGAPPPGRGTSAFDVTVLQINFDAPASANCLTFDFKFFSDEFPEFVGTAFNDAFIAELDASTWTTVGSMIMAPNNFAFDQSGNEISVNTAGFSAGNAAGTTYDGATVLLSASTQVTPGPHSLYLSIFDQGDMIYDSAVFLDNLRVGFVPNPEANCVEGAEPVDPEPATIVLTESPGHAPVNEVGTEHCVTATVLDDQGQPVAGVTVSFDVEGSSDEPVPFGDAEGSATTDQGGMAEFCYDGPDLPGADTIVAFIDEDADNMRDPEELQSNPLAKTWVPPETTPGCEINISNGGWITTATGSQGSFGGNAKAELDGTTKGSEEYQDHGLVPINIKSVEIVSILCQGETRAEIYGTATVNGLQPPVDFRIVVQDLGEPGSKDAPRDTYQIITGAYTSGAENNPLQGGNVQIHRFS
jgi:hypothetical protein